MNVCEIACVSDNSLCVKWTVTPPMEEGGWRYIGPMDDHEMLT